MLEWSKDETRESESDWPRSTLTQTAENSYAKRLTTIRINLCKLRSLRTPSRAGLTHFVLTHSNQPLYSIVDFLLVDRKQLDESMNHATDVHQDSNRTTALAGNDRALAPFDLALLIDQCVGGAISLVSRLARTLFWFVLRPVQLAERVVQPDFGKTFCPPLAFLVLGIIGGFAVMHDVWILSEESVSRMSESELGWAAWIAQSLFDDLSKISLSSLIMRTLPTALVTVIAAACLGRWLGGRSGGPMLATAACLVIGFKLYLRFAQGIANLALVWFAKMGSGIVPASWDFAVVMQAVMYLYFAAIAYIFLFAGVRFLAAVMQLNNRRGLQNWPVSMGLATAVSSCIFVGTFVAPSSIWNAYQLPQIQNLCLLKALPLSPARLEFQDGDDWYLTTTVLMRNETDRQILVALPRQIDCGGEMQPIECHYEGEPILEGACLLEAGASRIVRATWRLNLDHRIAVVTHGAIPLLIQLGFVNDVMSAEIQSCSIDVALDADLVSQISQESRAISKAN